MIFPHIIDMQKFHTSICPFYTIFISLAIYNTFKDER